MKQDDIAHMRVTRAQVSWEEVAGRVVIQKAKMGRFGTGLLRLFRIKTTMDVRLDEMGSQVWRLLDGRTAGEVLLALQKENSGDDLGPRLGRYLGSLVSNELATLD